MTTARPDGIPAEGEILAGKYRLEGVLGQGGMGVVVAAQHVELRQRVAVKFLLPAATKLPQHRERFLREARAAAAMRSERAVRVLDVDALPSGTLYMVMERLEGIDLRALLIQGGPLPPALAVDYVLQACEAMADAHAQGIVHRDLKPSNLFLASGSGGEPAVKVLDFGLSKPLAGDDPSEASLTGTGVVMGSCYYMAPEQLRGLRLADARADIWSLGVILYELVTGHRPFEGKSLTEVAFKVVEDAPEPMGARGAQLSPALEAVIVRCLEKQREHRPQTVADLARALTPFSGEAGRASADRVARGASRDSSSGPRLRSAADAASKTAALDEALHLSETAPVASGTLAQVPAPPAPRRLRLAAAVAFVVAATGAALLARAYAGRRASSEIDGERLASFAALAPPPPPQDAAAEARIRLGKALFSDPRISKNGNVSCATCHPLGAWGADGKRLSRGSDDKEPPRNTLGIYNVGGFFALLWDGRKDELTAQARDVMLSPRAMAMTEERLQETLQGIPAYAEPFSRAFPGEARAVSFENTARALAAFEDTLVTRGRWDRFLEGDRAALTDQEKAGFNRFVDVGCISCHFGPNVGATMFQKVGLVKAWPNTKDRGRYEITRRDTDWMVFRVPSLRNVAKTAPYFHDGSIVSLPEAIRLMAHHQIGRDLDEEDVSRIAAWLSCLTGDLPPDVVKP